MTERFPFGPSTRPDLDYSDPKMAVYEGKGGTASLMEEDVGTVAEIDAARYDPSE